MSYPWLASVLAQLSQRAVQQSLHHGLLFHGPKGVGKTAGAYQMAKLLLCKQPDGPKACEQCQSCSLFAASSHPDFHPIKSDKQIGVDLIRQAIQSLSGTAQLSGNKVLVIEQADSLTESAANALLKTLEEPTGNTYLLLVTAKPERLLPTVRSRCEKVLFSPPDLTFCKDWLAEQGYQDLSDEFLQIYACCPLTIVAELEKQQGITYEVFIQGISQLTTGHVSAIDLAEKWQADAEQVVIWLQHRLRDLLPQKRQLENFWQMEQHLRKATQLLRNPGVNKVVILCGLLQDLLTLNRTEPLLEE